MRRFLSSLIVLVLCTMLASAQTRTNVQTVRTGTTFAEDLSGANRYNLTFSDYIAFVDSIYNGYFSARYDNAEGWFEADSTGADGDGYTADVPWTYENAAALSYCGLKAWQGQVSTTLATRCASVIDKIFVSPVWAAGNDLTRSLECTGSVGSPTCAAGSSFSAPQMATRAGVFSLEAYPGAFLCWKYAAALGIGTTRKNLLKSFIDDTINTTPTGYNQGDLFEKPVHLYVKHLAGTSQVSAFSTLAGNSGGWGQRFDTAASVLPYVTDSFAWNYDQTDTQTAISGFQTLEYLGFQAGAGAYEAMVTAGSTRNATADARLRAIGLRLMGYIGHNGWPSAWLTQYGSGRQDLPGYALGYVNPGLDNVMANSTLFSEQERRWAKYLFDRGIATFRLMDTYGGDAADGMVNPEPYGAASTTQEQDGDKAVAAGHVMRAIAWHLILGNDLIEAEEPPNLAWYDWQQNSLAVSTPTYSTFLYGDIEGAYAFGLNSQTYETASGAHNLGFLNYNPTNEHVIDRPDENQVATLTASAYAGGYRRLEHGLYVFQSLAGSTNVVLDELSSIGSVTNAMLRPLMKTDTFSVRGWGLSGSGYSRRPLVRWEPTWKDGELVATSTIDRSDDSDAGFDDYKDVVAYRFHDDFIEESHDVTTPGGACATCFAYYLLRPPNNGQAYLTHAGRIYDSASTIGVRYEVQHTTATDWQPTTITYTGASIARNSSDGNGCVSAADGCTGAGAPDACCDGADVDNAAPFCNHDSGGGVAVGNVQAGSVRFNTNVTFTLAHSIDTDMGVTAAADNRVSYQVIGRKYSGSPNFLVTLDGGTQRSKSSAGGDSSPTGCLSAGEVAGDWQATIYNSSADDAATVMTAGAHTVAVTNSSGSNIYLDAYQVTSQSPARFLDNETAGGWIPPANVPSGDNDWYLELRDSDATSGYIAWFPDKTLITAGIEARYVRKPSAATTYNNDPPSVVGLKLYGDNYGKVTVADSDATVPAFQFSVEYYPYNGDHYEANRIWEQVIKWRPRVRAFSGANATVTVSVNEIGIDVTPSTKVNVYGLDAVGALGVQLDVANDDLIFTRSDTGVSGGRISWNVVK